MAASSDLQRDFLHTSLPHHFKFSGNSDKTDENEDHDSIVGSGISGSGIWTRDHMNSENTDLLSASSEAEFNLCLCGDDSETTMNLSEAIDIPGSRELLRLTPLPESESLSNRRPLSRSQSESEATRLARQIIADESEFESTADCMVHACIGTIKPRRLRPRNDTKNKKIKVHPLVKFHLNEEDESENSFVDRAKKNNTELFEVNSSISTKTAQSGSAENTDSSPSSRRKSNMSAESKLSPISEVHESKRSVHYVASAPNLCLRRHCSDMDIDRAHLGEVHMDSDDPPSERSRRKTDDLVFLHLDRMLKKQGRLKTKSQSEKDLSNAALNLEIPRKTARPESTSALRSRPKLRRVTTFNTTHPLSRNVKTAPSTPESESRLPTPRHAESTSQLEMASYGKKVDSNGFTVVKYSENTPDLKPTDKKISANVSKQRNEKFHKLFKNIPEREKVLKSYLCAYVGDILLQGYFYILPNFFCFYTKILGHEKQLEIPVAEVIAITREKTALIIPNAIGILTKKDKYVFGSLMSRDSTYRLICNVWKKNGSPFTDLKASDSDSSTGQDYIVARDYLISQDDTPTANSFSLSENSEESICPQCGTPMIEHDGIDQCDNLPNADANIEIPELLANGSVPKAHKCTTENSSLKAFHPRQLSAAHHANTGKSNLCSFSFFGSIMPVPNVKFSSSIPKTNHLLFICLFISVILVIMAVMMTYKILLLQAEIDISSQWHDPTTSRYVHSQKLYSDLYYLNDRFHSSTIERFQNILEANIQLLSQVHASLFNLQKTSDLTEENCKMAPEHCHGNT